MQFFTPELCLRYNSRDDAIALAADAEWEAAIVKYHQHLDRLYGKMPSQVVAVSKLCLHDAEILQRQEQPHPLSFWSFEDRPGPARFWPFWHGLATVAVRLGDEVVTLIYFLWDPLSEEPAAEQWPFSTKREHWLYDEIHWQGGDRGRFTHVVLLSSGVVLTIPFGTVSISRFHLAPVDAGTGKQSA
ncbi:MAG TPA: hypothetical protein VFA18_19945 [Gemmataceae bacterium]|nr:hypothetical protein [Gemmataceae bacterium]